MKKYCMLLCAICCIFFTSAKQINASKIIADVYKSLTAYYYSINNSEAAFRYQKLFDAIRDSLFKVETDLKIANLKNRFELDLKLDELALKDIELSSTKKLSGERLKIIYVIGFAGFAMLILATFCLSSMADTRSLISSTTSSNVRAPSKTAPAAEVISNIMPGRLSSSSPGRPAFRPCSTALCTVP